MTTPQSPGLRLLTTALLASVAMPVLAETKTITVWAGGTNITGSYRYEAIEMAADILEREAALQGEELELIIEHQSWSSWDDFKQAVTLAAEAGNAPNIIVSGHEDIGTWSRSGLLRPVEDYVDLDAWPLSNIYPNLMEISSYEGVLWGLPQDAEVRPFFYSRAHLAGIGWTPEQIESLPERVEAGEYRLYDMLNDVKAMQDAGLIEPGRGFLPRVNNGADWWQFYQSFGGEMLDPDTGKLMVDLTALGAMYQFFVDAAAMGVVPSTWLGTAWDDFHGLVVGDLGGAWHGGSWHKSQWETQFGLTDFFGKIQYSLIPQGNDAGKPNTISHPLVYLLSTSGTEEDAEISAQLISIALEPRFNALHAVKSGKVALSPEQALVPIMANDRWAGIATTRLLPHANAVPNDVNFGVIWGAMFRGLESSWTGTTSVEAAVEAFRAEVTSALGDAVVIR